ncbi:hypothetical protein BKA67DRAFT_572461 [Truncatella angustata]|uniref:Uncharacterized protein n=1 Tax=Truncatella angustata TaxID=152316 RepID=A0A9P8UGU3_9PEZI|nr:uncharacterized protein BKA67DRAFT_572461 [Truncatella angustata]KAH6651940.1 hypothetical protein BKA67DRAFT_572461 [Truncatella angustata]
MPPQVRTVFRELTAAINYGSYYNVAIPTCWPKQEVYGGWANMWIQRVAGRAEFQ